MGNVLHTLRLVRAARRINDTWNDDFSSVLQLVEQRPALLGAKSGALGGTLWHWAAETGNALLLEGLIRLIIRFTSDTFAFRHDLPMSSWLQPGVYR
jgi:hypothetical protein